MAGGCGYVDQERAKFSRWLRENNIRFAVTDRASELAGAPSHIIQERPPLYPDAPGVMVLFKHPNRSPKDSQSKWLTAVERESWRTIIAFSAEQAIRETLAMGYQPSPP